MYLSHCEELFRVFQEPSSVAQELVFPLWLEQDDSIRRLACDALRMEWGTYNTGCLIVATDYLYVCV